MLKILPHQHNQARNHGLHRLSVLNAALLGATTLALPVSIANAQDSVEYQFTFVAEWSAQTHPVNFPGGNPHFTPVIGATHTSDLNIWTPGGIASDGLEVLAERGSRLVLEAEIEALIVQTGLIDQFRFLGGIDTSPGMRMRSLTVNAGFPVISLVSMLAPSPDWFIGVHDVDLRSGGIWTREIVIDLYAYDSGTDSGMSYNSPNADITPHIPITSLADVFPFVGTPRIGTFTFTLMSPASCTRADFAEPYDQLNFFDVSAFLSAFVANDPAADFNYDGAFNFFDVSAFLTEFTAGCP